MLGKLLIGGVTLATVGYGIKQYCEEEGCGLLDDLFDDAKPQTEYEPTQTGKSLISDNEILQNFYYFKISLYETTLYEFKSLYNCLENCDVGILKDSDCEFDIEEAEPFKEGFEKIVKRVTKYSSFLDKVSNLLDTETYKLRGILERSTDYTTFSKEEQTTVRIAYKLSEVMDTLFHAKLISKNGSVTKHSKQLLKSQKNIVEDILSSNDQVFVDNENVSKI